MLTSRRETGSRKPEADVALLKRVLRNEAVRRFLCWVGSGYVRLVHATGRWTVVGEIGRAHV